MKAWTDIEYTNIIEMSYLPATNTLGSRIKLYDIRNEVAVVLPRDYGFDVDEQGFYELQIRGHEVQSKKYNRKKDITYYVVANEKELRK